MFQVTPCSPCGTILLRTKLICSKRMRRLVSVHGFYIRWRIHCIRNHAQMLSSFPYGRTQHVRRMRSSIVGVRHYLSMHYFMSCHVTKDGSCFSGSANCPFYCKSETLLWLRSFSNYTKVGSTNIISCFQSTIVYLSGFKCIASP